MVDNRHITTLFTFINNRFISTLKIGYESISNVKFEKDFYKFLI